jgi:hypothetical protein
MIPELAVASHHRMLQPGSGFSPDGRLHPAGMERVLRLRSHHLAGCKPLVHPEKYVDLSYWKLAFW